ncbi:MAG: SDR family oxidoreductase [Advenella sp.]|uniref:3-oxoacyl-[acyl-carrier-protein] reductase n=1 Tax=Advenella kashmirensis TaxID=310575 RepID=A0A356LC48_9BURK|nr:SDR family oxidoreductase [Advenella sp. FME57]HBP28547.1 3-oxoacyl-[acyl-carrier-protein] reductase [Advenella kashmirensis]
MKKPITLKGARVMVSAGASGIGLAIARAFDTAGAQVHICDISDTALSTLRDVAPNFGMFKADVSDPDEVNSWFDHALHAMGGLDVLINNAGIAGPTAGIEKIAIDEWDRTMAVNVRSQFLCSRRAIGSLKESNRATIINLSSVAGRIGYPLRCAYAASKWAVIGMTQSLAIELGEHDITVNAILPGIVESERVNKVVSAKALVKSIPEAQMRAEILENVALHRMVPMEHIADTALFLASPAGRSVTGQSMNICAGVQALK